VEKERCSFMQDHTNLPGRRNSNRPSEKNKSTITIHVQNKRLHNYKMIKDKTSRFCAMLGQPTDKIVREVPDRSIRMKTYIPIQRRERNSNQIMKECNSATIEFNG